MEDVVSRVGSLIGAAGGAVWRLDGQPIAYNKRNFLNPDFIAIADAAFPWPDRLPDPKAL